MAKQNEAAELIDAMQNTRAGNNVTWMGFVRLAFEHAPEEAKVLARQVGAADQEIREIWEKLGEA